MTLINQTIAELLTWLVARSVHGYLVGGYVRDMILGRETYNLDIAIAEDPIRLGREVADHFRGTFFVLDKERHFSRALLPLLERRPLEVDLTPLKDADIFADLATRDFTINAMALPLTNPTPTAVIDPHGGREDLRRKRLRAVSPTSFVNDPIRILRAARFAQELGLEIDPQTRTLMQESAHLIPRDSAERIRDEFCRLLSLTPAAPPLIILHEAGILWTVLSRFTPDLPEPLIRNERFIWAVEVITHLEGLLFGSLAELGALCSDPLGRSSVQALSRYRDMLLTDLEQSLVLDRSRLLLLKLVALAVCLLGTESVEPLLETMRLSATEIRRGKMISQLISIPVRWAKIGGPSRTEVYRFYQRAGNAGPDALVFYLATRLALARRDAGQRAGLYAEITAVEHALQAYYKEHHIIVSPPQLVSGKMLMTYLDLPPGPHIGALLEQIREAQVEGRVKTREDALNLAKDLTQGRKERTGQP